MRAVLSIRTFIAVLVVGSVLPLLVFSGLLVHRSAGDEQELIARTVRDVAQGAAGDINRQLSGLQSLAFALADSRLLQTGDLAAFHTHASELVRRQNLTAVLYDLAGRQLVNTAVPFGVDLPAEPQAVRRVIETGQADISDLVTDARTGTPVIWIAVPVLRDGHLADVLSVQISNAIAAVMAEQLVQPEQTVGLVDRSGFIIYRTRDPDQFIGLRAPPDFLAQTQGRDEGTFLSHTRAGVPAYIAFSRVKLAGWVVGVSIPRHVLFAPANQSLLLLGVLGAVTLLIAGFIAWAIGRAITGPVSGLSRFAAALAAGEQQALPPGPRIREVDAVAATLLAETETLRQQVEQQQRTATALQEEVESRQRVERQLVQAQKMEAVGQLTGGLAHDFNNLLAIAIGNLDMLRELRPDDPQGDEFARGALEAVLRGADLIRQMLAFARRQSLAPEQCDINQVISVIVALLRRTLGEAIVIDLSLSPDLWPVLIDRVQFEAAITNLATNARDAMPRGGRLTITTRNTQLDEDYAATHSEVSPGDYVSIEVHDTGTGIPPEVLDHIFEPFFTTKEPGQGTGLGLSMVFGFLKQSSGHISAYSEVGEGTTFRLYLPPVRDAVTSGDAATHPPSQPGQNEMILVVEDSAGLRQMLCRQLTEAGYRVLEASDGRMALAVIETDAAIDLMLTDIVMPGGMNGHELTRAALNLRPQLKTLLTTGFAGLTNGAAAAAQHARILRKPYRKEELLRLVHETLNG